MDPDPGGPKTCGSGGSGFESGSGTLDERREYKNADRKSSYRFIDSETCQVSCVVVEGIADATIPEDGSKNISLKVVGNGKGGWSGSWQMFEDGYGPRRVMSVKERLRDRKGTYGSQYCCV